MRILSKAMAVLLGATVFVLADPEPGQKKGTGRGKAGAGEAHREKGPDGPGRGEHGERRGPQRRDLMRKLDRNQDGAITFEEFSASEKMQNVPEEGQRRLFNHFDKNRDGAIRRAELPGEEGQRGPGPDIDQDGDGKITLEEFMKNPRLQKMSEERRKELFTRMDHNADGVLTPADWSGRKGSRPWDRRMPFVDRKVLEELDTDKDGALSFEEWKANPRHKEEMTDERLREMFQRMDRNKDGKLSPEDRPEGPRRGAGPGQGQGQGQGKEGKRPGGGDSAGDRPERGRGRDGE